MVRHRIHDHGKITLAYFLDLFSPETWAKYVASDRSISGFTPKTRGIGSVQPGDLFVCYLTGLSRWCGLLEIKSKMFHDSTPIFADPDRFTARFAVKPVVLLHPRHAIPIKDQIIWSNLSATRDLSPDSRRWTALVRSSLRKLSDADGGFLRDRLNSQARTQREYQLTKLESKLVDKFQSQLSVLEPEGNDVPGNRQEIAVREPRESIRMQAKVATIGAAFRYRIWIPAGDRSRVLAQVDSGYHPQFLNEFPLAYDQKTLSTIKQIDVLWIDRQSMSRAFEIEHSTAVYSGLLRMADLVALQPNMDIQLHIVAPKSKSSKVKREILRPVFEGLRGRPLRKRCTFLSYEDIESLEANPNLKYFRDDILDQYQESARSD